MRWSRYRWVPHFLWVPPGGLDHARLEHFVPVTPGRGRPWQIWRSVLFRGRVRVCDHPECTTMESGECARSGVKGGSGREAQ